MRAIVERFGQVASIQEDSAVHKDFATSRAMPSSGRSGRAARGRCISSAANEKLGESLLLQMDAAMKQRADFSVIALIEEPHMPPISRRKFQRAQNRDLAMPIPRGDEEAALDQIARKLEIKRSVA